MKKIATLKEIRQFIAQYRKGIGRVQWDTQNVNECPVTMKKFGLTFERYLQAKGKMVKPLTAKDHF